MADLPAHSNWYKKFQLKSIWCSKPKDKQEFKVVKIPRNIGIPISVQISNKIIWIFWVSKYSKLWLCKKCLNFDLFFGPYFLIYRLNTKICVLNFRIHSTYGKTWTRKNTNSDSFHKASGCKTKNIQLL